jgi:hypothetical protein
MSKAWQMDRALEREEESLARDLSEGRITNAEYNSQMRELQRDARTAYEEDLWDAQQRVREEWGDW